MRPEYEKAQDKSYAGQESELFIPTDKGVVEINLGFQPMGISAFDDRVFIASYFEPAICILQVKIQKDILRFRTWWIRGVNNGIDSVRLFTAPVDGDVNRAQTVNRKGNQLYLTRNADRNFFVLDPPYPTGNGKWNLVKRIELSGEGMVHSAVFRGEYLHTVESTLSLDKWFGRSYYPDFRLASQVSLVEFTYGVAFLGNDARPYYVTDYRSKRFPGIYRENESILSSVPRISVAVWRGKPAQLSFQELDGDTAIYGNGIAFLEDGSALVTRYGQASSGPLGGEPGKLIYIPAKYFQ